MNQTHVNLLKDYHTYLKLRDYKQRGMEDKLRSARNLLSYLKDNGLEPGQLRRKDAESYREHLATDRTEQGRLRYRAESVNGILACLRLFFDYLLSTDKAVRNVFREVERMKESTRVPRNILSIEETGRLLSGIKVEDEKDFTFKTAVEVLYAAGLRISELEGLQKQDIDTERGVVTVRDDKDRKDRIAPLTEYAACLLKEYVKRYEDAEFVFRRGKKRTFNSFVNNRLKALCKKLDLPVITCHGIRHSIATHMLKKGADIREVAEFLGHKRLKNTEVYTRLVSEDLKKVIDRLHPRERKEEGEE